MSDTGDDASTSGGDDTTSGGPDDVAQDIEGGNDTDGGDGGEDTGVADSGGDTSDVDISDTDTLEDTEEISEDVPDTSEDVPDTSAPPQPSGGGVTVTLTEEGENQRAVDSERVELTFSGLLGWSLTSARIPYASTDELIYSGTGSEERFTGVELWPHVFSYAPDGAPALTDFSNGPAVVRFRTAWSSGQIQNATTMWTIWPDGRVHRDDRFGLGNGNPSGWLVAYATINVDRLTDVFWTLFEPAEGGGPDTTVSGQEAIQTQISSAFDTLFAAQGGYGDVCGYHSTTGDTVGFTANVLTPEFAGLRAVANAENSANNTIHSVNFQADWVRSAVADNAQTYRGAWLMAFRSGTCANMTATLQAHRVPRPMLVTTGTLVLTGGETGDDNSDGYNEAGGFYQVSPDNTGRIVIQPETLPVPTLALRILDHPITDRPTVEINSLPVEDAELAWQPSDTALGGGWIFIDRELSSTDTLTVDLAN